MKKGLLLTTTILLPFLWLNEALTAQIKSPCWKRGVKSQVNSYGAFGSADYEKCAELLLEQAKYLSATVNTEHSICFLSESAQYLIGVEETNWYANKSCLVADPVVLGEFLTIEYCFSHARHPHTTTILKIVMTALILNR